MKFSDTTLQILKNFSSINQGLIFNEGNILKTISPQKSVLASAKIDEDIPRKAPIYDLPQLLSTLSLFKGDYDISFEEKNLLITNGKSKMKYMYSAEETIGAYPTKAISLPDDGIEFSLAWETMENAMKASAVFKYPEICFVVDERGIHINTSDSKLQKNNSAVNILSTQISDKSYDVESKYIIKMENLKMIASDYKVKLCSKNDSGIAYFGNEKIEYWVGLTVA